ncbi:flagellar basal body-associated protein FliL [Rouxiella sp. Mn2063]|uniref:flagellar basal body-associated protein FliL n=1 Tax=Rouxiella sp. Mn2063 TaxID=3395262 RepID=UPI003BE0D558
MSDNAIASKSKKKKRSLLVILLLLVIILGGAGGGYAWWILHNDAKLPETAETPKAKPPAPPVFLALDTFTVNLQTPDNNPDRVLYVGLTLRLPDENDRKILTEYLPEVRSRLLLLLSRQQSQNIANEAGKQQLVQEIKQVLSDPFVKGQPNQVVSDVLFTAFILR